MTCIKLENKAKIKHALPLAALFDKGDFGVLNKNPPIPRSGYYYDVGCTVTHELALFEH